MKTVLKKVHCVDPRSSLNAVRDILIDGDTIVDVGDDVRVKGAEVIEGEGLHCFPGAIDVHVHFREPGFEQKETLDTGIAAAINGGITACVTMPNTNPACDTAGVLAMQIEAGRRNNFSIYPCGSMTKGRKGEELAEMGDLRRSGAVCVSDDGSGVMNSLVMRRVMEYASMLNLPVAVHAEDHDLSMNGVMHEGEMSTRFGMKGIPSLSEYGIIIRDIELARLTGAHVHFQHISCAESVDAIRRAKRDGLRVTCEVTPHHVTFTDASMGSYDTTFKMNPPLRAQADVDALIAGVVDGTIDMIATDHAPHHAVEKDVEITNAPFGCIGLESSLGVVVNTFVKTKKISLEQFVSLVNVAPARLIGKPDFGALEKGRIANLTVMDMNAEWVVDPNNFKSKARNCPFAGSTITGKPFVTICNGVVHRCAL